MTGIDSLLLSFTANLTNLPKILLKECYASDLSIFAKDEDNHQSLIVRIVKKMQTVLQSNNLSFKNAV